MPFKVKNDASLVFSTSPSPFTAPPGILFLPARILKKVNYILELRAALKHIWSQQKELPQGGVILHLGDER